MIFVDLSGTCMLSAKNDRLIYYYLWSQLFHVAPPVPSLSLTLPVACLLWLPPRVYLPLAPENLYHCVIKPNTLILIKCTLLFHKPHGYMLLQRACMDTCMFKLRYWVGQGKFNCIQGKNYYIHSNSLGILPKGYVKGKFTEK